MRPRRPTLLGLLLCLSGCPAGDAGDLLPTTVRKETPLSVKVEFRLLVDDALAEGHVRLAEAVQSSALATASGISVRAETRDEPDGTAVPVRVVVARDRAGLASGLGELLAAQPELSPPPGEELVFAQRGDPDLGESGSPWRLYWANAKRQVQPKQLVSAEIVETPEGTPAVEVGLTADDAEDLAELTRSAVGQPLLFIVGDRVLSAPIVRTSTTGTKLIIPVDHLHASAEDRRAEATSLLRTLVGE